MAKNYLWDGVTEDDFIKEKNIESVDIAEYDLNNMKIFAANTNIWRHIIRLSDSLKPVERRILYVMYLDNAMNQNKKSPLIVGKTLEYHSHGDDGSYAVMVGMAQMWKKQCPVIKGKGNFGNSARSDLYAAKRYTEVMMSKYAKECFFEDYDPDCVEMVFNSASDKYEPMSLPAKFPNILVNGGMGIAFGNAFRIPSYNINDIIRVCKNVMLDPEYADVFMIPDLPSGCEIIDVENGFTEIIETGKGTLKMRASATIHDLKKYWGIEFTSLPWMVSLDCIEDKIAELTKLNKLPIKETSDNSQAIKMGKGEVAYQVSYTVFIDKHYDPMTILEKLYDLTELQKTVSIDFKAVTDNLEVKRFNMRQLISSWIDERRSYKRRLMNKKFNKVASRIELLEILIRLLSKDNINKTIDIVRGSKKADVVANLQAYGNMSSYQADKIASMQLSVFNQEAKDEFKKELLKLKDEYKQMKSTITSEKKIDELILQELDDLKKYARPRMSKIVKESTKKYISDTTHVILVTNDSFMKKLTPNPNKSEAEYQMGAFKTNDYPIHHTKIHNSNSIAFFDTFGKCTVMPVSDIDNTEPSFYGHRLYDVTRLTGKVVSVFEYLDSSTINKLSKKYGEPYLVTISGRGYAKKQKLNDFLKSTTGKNTTCTKLRDDDMLVYANILFPNTTIVIYSRDGVYSVLKVEDIVEQGKTSMGLITIKLEDSDRVCGMTVVGNSDTHLVVITEKGVCKSIGVKYIGGPTRRNSIKDQGSLITLDASDHINSMVSLTDDELIQVIMRGSMTQLVLSDIPELTKKAKGKRLISANPTNNIITVRVVDK